LALAGYPAVGAWDRSARPTVRQPHRSVNPSPDRATMPDRSQHESGFELPRRRFVRPVVGFGVLVVAALIAGTLERSERTRSSGQGETTTLAGGHSMAHASEPGSSPENGLAAAPKLQVVYDAEA